MTNLYNYVEDKVVMIVNDHALLAGTGFFVQEEYCVTCHHNIFNMNKIRIAKKGVYYDAEWIEKYSDITNDVAVLRIKDSSYKPVELANRLYKGLNVIIWGFPIANYRNLPSGKYIESTLLEDKLDMVFEPDQMEGKNKWNKKPIQSLEVYPINNKLEKGFSGAPVFFKKDLVVVGMYEAQDNNTGYVIPIEKIMFKLTNPDRELTTSAPITINSILDEGNEYFNKEEYMTAITYYDKIIRDNNLRSAFNNKGKSLSNLGKQDQALICFDRALEINNTDPVIWNNKGYAYYEKRSYTEAIKSFDRAIELDPKYVFAWTGKGECLFETADFKGALDCFNKAIDINPNYPRAASRIGQALEKIGEKDKAKEWWYRAIIMAPTPKDADEWNNRGFNLNQIEKYREAIESFDGALEINEYHTRALLNKGYALYKLHEYRMAIEYFNKLIDINDNDADAWWYKGEALKELQNIKESNDCFQTALNINPNYRSMI